MMNDGDSLLFFPNEELDHLQATKGNRSRMEVLEFRPEFEIKGLEYKGIVDESPFHSISPSNLHVPLLCVSVSVSLISRVTGFKTLLYYQWSLQYVFSFTLSTKYKNIRWVSLYCGLTITCASPEGAKLIL
jgi:hypothetical protein